MAINKEKRKRILQRAGVSFGVLLVAVGSWFFTQYENARLRDVQVMSGILAMQSNLASYAVRRGIYPVMGNEPLLLGSAQGECLSHDGFVNANTDACREKSFGFFSPVPGKDAYQFPLYASLDADAVSPCTQKDGCPWYSIGFVLETNSIAPKGLHNVTPQGFN